MTSPKRRKAKSGSSQVAAYSSAVDAANLETVRLVSSDFEIQPQALDPDQANWQFGFGCDIANITFSESRQVLSGWVHAEAFAKLSRRKIISAKCKYIVVYSFEGGPAESAAVAFLGRVGPFAVYPYFRSHFAELVSQAGIRMDPLPILKEGRRIIPKVSPQL